MFFSKIKPNIGDSNYHNLKTLRLMLSLLILVFLAGCDPNSFLNETPDSFLTEKNFYKNKKDAIASVNAIYDILQQSSLYKENMFRLVDFPSAQSTDNKSGGDLDLLTWDASTNPIYSVWRGSYDGINRANQSLKELPDIQMEDSLRRRLLGEAHFLRGLLYFNLIKLFGNIPVIKKPTSSLKNLNPTNKNTHKEAWALIISDFKNAENSLPLSYNGSNIGRATKGAAQSMLAKVYLQRSGLAKYAPNPSIWGVENVDEWDKALQKIQKLIDSEEYELFQNYKDVYDVSTKNGKEHIFSVQYLAGIGKPEGMANIIKMIGIRKAGNINPYGGRSDWTGEPVFFNSWPQQDKDKRFPVTWILHFKLDDGTEINYPESNFLKTPHTQKFRVDPEDKARLERFSANFPLLRYADVLLMQSEASNESGNGDPYYGINKVRARAGLDPLSGLSPEQLRKSIVEERALELCFEAHAFFDYQRFGILKEKAAMVGHNNVESFRYIYPIPQDEMDRNANLTQNPGY